MFVTVLPVLLIWYLSYQSWTVLLAENDQDLESTGQKYMSDFMGHSLTIAIQLFVMYELGCSRAARAGGKVVSGALSHPIPAPPAYGPRAHACMLPGVASQAASISRA